MVRLLKIALLWCAALLAGGATAQPTAPCSKNMPSTATWQLIPRQGIACGEDLRVTLGQERDALQAAMAAAGFVPPKAGRYPDEDDFLTADKSTFIRVRYGGSKVQDIEFLAGTLKYRGVDLHRNTTFAKLRRQFKSMKLGFRDTQWLGDGQDCPELHINIATHENVGGDGDGIEWVILSSTFQ
jgi:hypothetical protein